MHSRFLRTTSKTVFLAVAVVGLAATIPAATITFDPLSGANGDPYPGHTEGNFSVLASLNVSGNPAWFEAHQFGNPVPSIFAGSPEVSSVSVTENTTGLFRFGSVDLSSNIAAGSTYDITGFLLGSPVLSQSGAIGSINTFETISSVNTSTILDLLVIELTPGAGTTSMNLDNIVLEPEEGGGVPEPSTFAMMGGLIILLGTRRLRKQ